MSENLKELFGIFSVAMIVVCLFAMIAIIVELAPEGTGEEVDKYFNSSPNTRLIYKGVSDE